MFRNILRMREYTFTAKYGRGADAVMDVFIDYPDLLGTALNITASSAGLWRVDRLAGPSPALDAAEAVFTDKSVCNECLGEHGKCDISGEYEVVTESPTSRVLYSYADNGTYCHSVPFIAHRTFGDGLLFDAQRRANVYEWRVLMPGDPPIGDLFNELVDGLPERVFVSLSQVGTPSAWGVPTASLDDLSHEQRRALEAAVRQGYYATPRDASLGDIADQLGLPKSTLRYRLRRAEAWLTETTVVTHSLLDTTPELGVADD
jgi:hypothetical protein